jgi:hypothetical protein
MEDARRGFVAMNNALQIETLRRRQQQKGLAEKTGSDKGTRLHQEANEMEIAQLDISDPAAVAVAVAVGSVASNKNHNREESVSEKEARTSDVSAAGTPAAFSEGVQEPIASPAPATEKPVEKRTSIIGAVSSLFTSSKTPSSGDRLPQSTSKDDLISKVVAEESEEHLNDQDTNNHDDGDVNDDDGDDDDGEGDDIHEVEDPEAKKAREAKNAERIELDLGSGDLSLGDFGI